MRNLTRCAKTIGLLAVALAAMTCTFEEPPSAPPPDEQGLGANEEDAAAKAIAALLAEPRIAMVVTCRRPVGGKGDFTYEAWSDGDRDGHLTHFAFTRVSAGDGTWRFERGPLLGDTDPGQDPLERTDPGALATRAEELAASGGKPYVPVSATSWPYAYERLAAAFDHRDAGDLAVIYTPSGTAHNEVGAHGNLNVTQSRSPLLLAGPGIKKAAGGRFDVPAKLTDIAPTLAHLLGVRTVDGKRADGSIGPTYLARQDGRVIEEALAPGARAERALVIVSDGMSHTRLVDGIEKGRLPNLARLAARGGLFRHGAIANFPSNTFPGHNVIGTGVWSGRHGLLDNHYWDRRARAVRDPYDQKIGTSDYLSKEVETLYEALTRTDGAWKGGPTGAYTVSINTPCARGASFSILDLKLPDGFPSLAADCSGIEAMDGLSPYLAANYALNYFSTLAAQRQYTEAGPRRHPLPRLVILNLPLTDSLAHEHGPHHPLSDKAFEYTDALIGCLLRTLEAEGLADTTLIALTADHGMEDQDLAIGGGIEAALARAGVKAVHPGGVFVYLKCLDLGLSTTSLRAGRAADLEVTVRDDDHDERGARPAVAGATVTARAGRLTVSATTDYGGRATLRLPPLRAGTTVEIVAMHPAYNPVRARVAVTR